MNTKITLELIKELSPKTSIKQVAISNDGNWIALCSDYITQILELYNRLWDKFALVKINKDE